MTPIGRVLLFILVGIYLIAAWPQDKKDVKPQEPHYKNGEHNRDYHGDKNDDGDESTEEKAAKCPFMSEAKNEGGCPYKKHREVDVADCPSFKDGCPYASGDSSKEKIKDCPAFKEGCPYKEGDHADAAIQDCPAFQGGCPYHSHKEAHYHHDCPVLRSTECPYLKGEKDLKKIADCPKFKEGCPFSDEKDMLEKAKGCPHFKEGCPFASNEKLDLSEWKNCPAFKDGCPYDTVVEHVHGHEQKLIAQEVLSAHLVGNGFDRLPSLLAENFSATLKGTLSPALKNAPLDKKAFLEFSTNIHANVKWTVTPVTVVSEGHTVVIHSRLDDKEAKDIAMVTIFHFNSEHKLESLVDLFTEGQLLGFHVDPRQ